jgi:hypothetical protein
VGLYGVVAKASGWFFQKPGVQPCPPGGGGGGVVVVVVSVVVVVVSVDVDVSVVDDVDVSVVDDVDDEYVVVDPPIAPTATLVPANAATTSSPRPASSAGTLGSLAQSRFRRIQSSLVAVSSGIWMSITRLRTRPVVPARARVTQVRPVG